MLFSVVNKDNCRALLPVPCSFRRQTGGGGKTSDPEGWGRRPLHRIPLEHLELTYRGTLGEKSGRSQEECLQVRVPVTRVLRRIA